MAEGLAKAHQAGIVHRDLKPENIIISDDGYVKILDFGLAKLLPAGDIGSELSTLVQETTPGTILGTVGYMSPEQAKGEAADFRSDQFSFGAIVYEMATGKRAFVRDSTTQTLTAIIEADPDPLTSAARVIDRCLSKDPAERYDSTGNIAKDLSWEEPTRRHQRAAVWAGGAMAIILLMILAFIVPDVREWVLGESQGPKIESIAVLPLENLSGDAEQEYFVDGMTEALMTGLAKIGALKIYLIRARLNEAADFLGEPGRTLENWVTSLVNEKDLKDAAAKLASYVAGQSAVPKIVPVRRAAGGDAKRFRTVFGQLPETASTLSPQVIENYGGADETRTRDLRRDRPAF